MDVWGYHLVCIGVLWLIPRNVRVVKDLPRIIETLGLMLVVVLLVVDPKVVPVQLLVKFSIDLAQDFDVWSLSLLELIAPPLHNFNIDFLHISVVGHELPRLP